MQGTLDRKTGRVALNPRSHWGFAASPPPICVFVPFHRARAYRNGIQWRCITYTKSLSKFVWYGIHTGQIAARNCLPGVATPRPTHAPFQPCSFVRAATLRVRSSRAASLQPSDQRRASVCGPAAALRSGFVLLDALLRLRCTSSLADRRAKRTRTIGGIT